MGSTGWACVRSSIPSSAESRSTATLSNSCSVCLQREGLPEAGWNPIARVFCRIVQTRRHEIAGGTLGRPCGKLSYGDLDRKRTAAILARGDGGRDCAEINE